MLSLPRPLVKGFIRKFMHFEQFIEAHPKTYRRAMERFALPAPRGVRVEKVRGAVRGEWLIPKDALAGQCLLYLHGGAYVFGSCATHREFAGRLARLTGRRVFLLEYRLAPEHPFPAAHDDAVAAFQWLQAQGYAADQIVIAGDSAGGGLTLSTGLGLRDRGIRPAGLAVISPWVDLTKQDPHPDLAARDPMIDARFGHAAADCYCGGEDPRHPLISPLFGELAGLPPVLIHVGTEEILLGDAERFTEKAKAAGVEVDLQVWDGMWHVWHLFALVVPEGRRAQKDIARFVEEVMAKRSSNVM